MQYIRLQVFLFKHDNNLRCLTDFIRGMPYESANLLVVNNYCHVCCYLLTHIFVPYFHILQMLLPPIIKPANLSLASWSQNSITRKNIVNLSSFAISVKFY